MRPSQHFVPGVVVRREVLCFLLAVAALILSASAESASTGPFSPAVRYQYGDNPAWANRAFDDSAWSLAADGAFPAPRFDSDGFFWMRVNLPVPASVNGPSAIQAALADSVCDVVEVFVNGVRVGQYGQFPPHAAPLIQPRILVFNIPAEATIPGTLATVALRGWRSLFLLSLLPQPKSPPEHAAQKSMFKLICTVYPIEPTPNGMFWMDCR